MALNTWRTRLPPSVISPLLIPYGCLYCPSAAASGRTDHLHRPSRREKSPLWGQPGIQSGDVGFVSTPRALQCTWHASIAVPRSILRSRPMRPGKASSDRPQNQLAGHRRIRLRQRGLIHVACSPVRRSSGSTKLEDLGKAATLPRTRAGMFAQCSCTRFRHGSPSALYAPRRRKISSPGGRGRLRRRTTHRKPAQTRARVHQRTVAPPRRRQQPRYVLGPRGPPDASSPRRRRRALSCVSLVV